eukprot:351462-Chlamydomonas_euryale.AAC.4
MTTEAPHCGGCRPCRVPCSNCVGTSACGSPQSQAVLLVSLAICQGARGQLLRLVQVWTGKKEAVFLTFSHTVDDAHPHPMSMGAGA